MNILRHPATILVLILLIVLLFGSRRLPDLARSVGESLKIFKKEVKDLREDDAPATQPTDGTTNASAAETSDGAPGTTTSTPGPDDGGTPPPGTSPKA